MDEIAFGRGVRAIRIRKRLTQEQLGERAGVTRGVIARIEQGGGSRVTVATLDRVAAALGARVFVKLLWQGEVLDRLLDGRHARTVESVVRYLRSHAWEVATEVSFNEFGERGSIDILAFHPDSGILLVVEVKTVIADAQDLQATLDRKVRLGPTIARRRGWSARAVASLLVVVDSRTNRRRVEALSATFAGAFPDRGVAVRRWLRRPDPVRPVRALWFLTNESEAVVVQRVGRPRRGRERGAPDEA